jgi:hypothetical protein
MRDFPIFDRKLFALVALLSIASCARNCRAVFFDLRGLTPSESFSYNLSQGGINVTVGGSGQKLKSGPTTLGIDLNSPNDDPALIDGGSGSAESFAILVSQHVVLKSILISQFDAVDSGSFNIKGGSTFALANGLNVINEETSGSSANFLRWTGQLVAGGGRGFSVDGFTVRLAGMSGQSGDYNNDGDVDSADYVVWRKHLPSGGQLANDDTTGADAGDHGIWRANYGAGAAGTGGQSAAVPEPAVILICASGAVVVLTKRRSRERACCLAVD